MQDEKLKLFMECLERATGAKALLLNLNGEVFASNDDAFLCRRYEYPIAAQWTNDMCIDDAQNTAYFRLSAGQNVQTVYMALIGCDADALERGKLMAGMLRMERWPMMQRMNLQDFYKESINGHFNNNEMHDIAIKQYNLDTTKQRVILVVEETMQSDELLLSTLNAIFPPSENVVVLQSTAHQCALVMEIEKDDSQDSEKQMAAALLETLETEFAMRAYIGIGRRRTPLYALKDSYNEAQQAIRMGKQRGTTERMFDYQSLLLERFLYEIPRDIVQPFFTSVFHEDVLRRLDEELRLTAETFLQCDLNLSEAARRLYVHRNTLVYRLSKLKQITGLDIREFDDAVLYKLTMILARYMK